MAIIIPLSILLTGSIFAVLVYILRTYFGIHLGTWWGIIFFGIGVLVLGLLNLLLFSCGGSKATDKRRLNTHNQK
jgi:hypothetical protein